MRQVAADRLARIIGMGSYVPERVLSNADLEKLVDTSDEWIYTRTGIRERRIAGEEEFPSTMGLEAARRALRDSALSTDLIELVIVATMTPDHICPSTAALIEAELFGRRLPALDIQAACTGHLYALSMAKAYIESGMYRCVLVVSTEKMSAFVDYEDRATCVLFGDGASAAVVAARGPGLAIDHLALGSDGSLGELICIPSGGARSPASEETVAQKSHCIRLHGKEVFKHAVRRMAEAVESCLEQAGAARSEISWFVPHQANWRIMHALCKQLAIQEERLWKTIHKYGNTSASSVGIALDELEKRGKLEGGSRVLLIAFGGGLTWGAALLTKTE